MFFPLRFFPLSLILYSSFGAFVVPRSFYFCQLRKLVTRKDADGQTLLSAAVQTKSNNLFTAVLTCVWTLPISEVRRKQAFVTRSGCRDGFFYRKQPNRSFNIAMVPRHGRAAGTKKFCLGLDWPMILRFTSWEGENTCYTADNFNMSAKSSYSDENSHQPVPSSSVLTSLPSRACVSSGVGLSKTANLIRRSRSSRRCCYRSPLRVKISGF